MPSQSTPLPIHSFCKQRWKINPKVGLSRALVVLGKLQTARYKSMTKNRVEVSQRGVSERVPGAPPCGHVLADMLGVSSWCLQG